MIKFPDFNFFGNFKQCLNEEKLEVHEYFNHDKSLVYGYSG